MTPGQSATCRPPGRVPQGHPRGAPGRTSSRRWPASSTSMPAEQAAYLAKLSTGDRLGRGWRAASRPEQSVEVAARQGRGQAARHHPGAHRDARLSARRRPGRHHAGQPPARLRGRRQRRCVRRRAALRRRASRGPTADSRDVASIAGAAAGRGRWRASPTSAASSVPPLRLTIDARLQRQVEIELNTAHLANEPRASAPSSWTPTRAPSWPRPPCPPTTPTTTPPSPRRIRGCCATASSAASTSPARS